MYYCYNYMAWKMIVLGHYKLSFVERLHVLFSEGPLSEAPLYSGRKVIISLLYEI